MVAGSLSEKSSFGAPPSEFTPTLWCVSQVAMADLRAAVCVCVYVYVCVRAFDGHVHVCVCGRVYACVCMCVECMCVWVCWGGLSVGGYVSRNVRVCAVLCMSILVHRHTD